MAYFMRLSTSTKIAIGLGVIYIIWGSTYLGIRLAIDTIPPFIMSGIRFLTAGLLLYAWSRYRGIAKPTARQWRSSWIVGGLLLLMGNGGLAWAEQSVPSGIAALIIASIPIWFVMLDWLWQKNRKPTPRVMTGLLLGVAGILLLTQQTGHEGQHAFDMVAVIVLLIAAFAWAFGSVYAKTVDLPKSAIMSISLQMLTGGVLLVAAGTISGEWARFDINEVTLVSAGALAYLITFGAMIGFSCYFWLLKAAPAEIVATYAYVNPVVAVFLGWMVLSEPVTSQTLFASAVIIVAVFLITSRKQAVKQAAPVRTSNSTVGR